MKLLIVLSLVFSYAALADNHMKKKVSHDKEHHHVKAKGDHVHDEAHHKEHDHKAHHPKHDEEAHLDEHNSKKSN